MYLNEIKVEGAEMENVCVSLCLDGGERKRDTENRGIGEQRKRTLVSAQSKLLNRTRM